MKQLLTRGNYSRNKLQLKKKIFLKIFSHVNNCFLLLVIKVTVCIMEFYVIQILFNYFIF